MSFTYAIPDLHGRFDLFELVIAEIARRGGGKVVFLGDYVDRGPQSRQVVEKLMAGPPPDQEWIILRGNHEDMMCRTLLEPLDPEWWVGNGGDATLDSYGNEVPSRHIHWLDRLPLFHETEHRIYCHAGGEPYVPRAEQGPHGLLWNRLDRDYDYGIDGKHVVHGHTPFEDGPVCLTQRTNLDTLSYRTGRLAVGVFDETKPGGPIEVLWINAEGRA